MSTDTITQIVDIDCINVLPELRDALSARPTLIPILIEQMRKSGMRGFPPLIVWNREGQTVLVDGHHRFHAAKEAGLTRVPVDYQEFDSVEDARTFARSVQIHRRNLADSELFQMGAKAIAKAQSEGLGIMQARAVAAKETGIGTRTLERFGRISTDVALASQVSAGRMPMREAERVIAQKSKAENTSRKRPTTVPAPAPAPLPRLRIVGTFVVTNADESPLEDGIEVIGDIIIAGETVAFLARGRQGSDPDLTTIAQEESPRRLAAAIERYVATAREAAKP